MKDYLDAFNKSLPETNAKFSISLKTEPTKPTKPSFEGFDGRPDKDFSDFGDRAEAISNLQISADTPGQQVAGTCPVCADSLDLQDRAHDAWWCAGCRRWFDGAGKPLLSSAQKQQRPTVEDEQARQLLQDLKSAGCGIYFDGEELRITNIARISIGLMARLETAGAEFRRVAIASLQTSEGS